MEGITRYPDVYKEFSARFDSHCNICGCEIKKDDSIFGTKYTDYSTGKSKWDIICKDCMSNLCAEDTKKMESIRPTIIEKVLEEKALEDSKVDTTEKEQGEIDTAKLPYKEFLKIVKEKARFKIC